MLDRASAELLAAIAREQSRAFTRIGGAMKHFRVFTTYNNGSYSVAEFDSILDACAHARNHSFRGILTIDLIERTGSTRKLWASHWTEESKARGLHCPP